MYKVHKIMKISTAKIIIVRIFTRRQKKETEKLDGIACDARVGIENNIFFCFARIFTLYVLTFLQIFALTKY